MRLLASLAVTFLLAAPVQAADQGSDDWIHDQVRMRLASDRDVRGNSIEVTVEQGVVTLSGPVRNEKAKKKAAKLAGKVKGVKKVVNELTVRYP